MIYINPWLLGALIFVAALNFLAGRWAARRSLRRSQEAMARVYAAAYAANMAAGYIPGAAEMHARSAMGDFWNETQAELDE